MSEFTIFENSTVSSHGITSSQSFFLDPQRIIHACANGLRVFAAPVESRPPSKEDWIVWGRGWGIGCIAYCRRTKVIAYAEKKQHPKIHLWDLTTRSLLQTLSGGTELEYAALAISRNGARLVSVGCLPDFSIVIWNMKTGQVILKGTAGVPTTHVSFNPCNGDQFCTSGNGNCVFWTIDQCHQSFELLSRETVVKAEYSSHVWNFTGDVFTATDAGELLRINSESGDLAPGLTGESGTIVVSESACVCLDLTPQFVVVATKDGVVHWIDNKRHKLCFSQQFGSSPLSLSLSPDVQSMMMTTLDGSMYLGTVPMDLARPGDEDLPDDLTIDVTKVADNHSGSVTGMATFNNSSVAVTVGQDGTVRFWGVLDNALLSCLSLQWTPGPVTLTTVHTHPEDKVVAVGSEEGVVFLIDCSDVRAPELVDSLKLHSQAVARVRFDKFGQYLATVAADKCVFFLDARSLDALKVIGFVELPHVLTDVVFHDNSNSVTQAYVCTTEPEVFRLNTPPVDLDLSPHFKVPDSKLKKFLIKLEFAPTCLIFAERGPERFYCLCVDKRLKQYSIPEEKMGVKSKLNNQFLVADFELEGHVKLGYTIDISPDMQWLVTGAKDGSVILRKLSELSKGTTLRRHDSQLGGVSAVGFTGDSRCLVSCGHDGAVLAMIAQGIDVPMPAPLPEPKLVTVEERRMLLRFSELLAKVKKEFETDSTAEKNRIRIQLSRLKQRFKDLLNRNETMEDLEKLDRFQFVIDDDERDRLVAEGDKQVEQVRQDTKFEDLTKVFLWHEIKGRSYDCMQVAGTKITGLIAPLEVENLPLQTVSDVELRHLEAICAMRRVEAKYGKSDKALYHADILESAAAELRAKKAAAASEKGEKVKDEEKPGTPVEEELEVEEDDDGGEDASDQDLLYSAYELHDGERKLTQMHLLKKLVRDVKINFNKEFTKTMEIKLQELQKIADKNKRVAEILNELKIKEDLFQPERAACEMPEKVLEVLDSEVKAEKVLSAEEQERLRLKKLQDEERNRGTDNERDTRRALEQMMNGSLEAKKEKAEEQLERPEWMDGPLDQMTDIQLALIKEYEAKVKAAQEEADKHRKVLDAEMKKLKRDINETSTYFDERLQSLFDARLQAQATIYKHELALICLAYSLMEEEENGMQEHKYTAQLGQLKAASGIAVNAHMEFKKEVEKIQAAYEEKLVEDKAQDKAFKKDFQDTEAFYNPLLKLWRLRKYPEKPEFIPGDDHQEVLMAEHERQLAEMVAVPEPLDDEVDMPEGIPTDMWELFLETRQMKINTELEIKQKAITLNDMNKRLAKLSQEDDEVRQKWEDVTRALHDLRGKMERDEGDLTILFELKQGQVELDQTQTIPEYDDCLLIDRRVVEDLNAQIKSLGAEMVAIMKETMDDKKKITMLDWSNQSLELKAEEVAENTRYFQLLRVTKSLQEMIKGGEDVKKAAEMALLEKQLEHGKRLHEYQLEEIKRHLFGVQRQINEKQLENEKLDEYVEDLAMSVAQREKIVEFRGSGEEKEKEREFHMKEFQWRRLVLNEAKQQTADIDLMKMEVERLRQRTFPSFAKSYKQNSGIHGARAAPRR